MKKRIIAVVSVLLILAFVCSFFGCGTRANWAAQKSDTKMNELNLREANGSEKYIVFAAMTMKTVGDDQVEELIAAGDHSSEVSSYAVVGYTGLVAELIIPDEFAPTGGEAKPVMKVLAVDPYSDYKCYRNGVSYTGEDARLQNNTVVTTLSFGSNMTYVGSGVCAGMTNLYDVIFTRSGDSVEIGAYAFSGCPNLSRLTYLRTDDYISFGEYPQTKVTDSAIITALNAQAGTLPTETNAQNWTSYRYYISGSNATDFMWYIDLSYNGDTYRGVYFTQYRPWTTIRTGSASDSYQDDNGYYINTVYWFKFEPIRWRILYETNGEILLFSDSIIDCHEYYHSLSSHTYNNETVLANNYAASNVRSWLRDSFYEIAFSAFQKGLIKTTNVDNSARSTNLNNNPTERNDSVNNCACENTQDKIFLLSVQEITNLDYGFAPAGGADNGRKRLATDYARSQGSSSTLYRLRSPDITSSHARLVGSNGSVGSQYGVYDVNLGIVPAMWVKQS